MTLLHMTAGDEHTEPLLSQFHYTGLPDVHHELAMAFQSMAHDLVYKLKASATRSLMLEHLLKARAAALQCVDAPDGA